MNTNQNQAPYSGCLKAAFLRLTARAVLLFCIGMEVQSARGPETLTGSVTNSATGRTLQGAQVVFQETGREALTDSEGAFRFDNVAPGNVTLLVSYTGLDTTHVPVVVRAGTLNRAVV